MMASDREASLRALLAVLDSSPGPVGTRAARDALRGMGISLSESSVSRRLRELDDRGWSVPIGTKGRVLSTEGRSRLAELDFSERTVASLGQVVDVKDVKDLVDLLNARKAVESAAAADAATYATSEDLGELEQLIARHRAAVGTPKLAQQPGLDFHRKIADIAPNRMLKTLTGIVLAPHLDRVEAVLDIVLGTDDHQHHVAGEHQRIAEAILSRDPRAAEAAMDDHFESMISASERIIAGEQASVVARLLSWIERAGHTSRQGE